MFSVSFCGHANFSKKVKAAFANFSKLAKVKAALRSLLCLKNPIYRYTLTLNFQQFGDIFKAITDILKNEWSNLFFCKLT